MKKKLIILALVFAVAKLFGQDYYAIDFVGEGATIESIYVENLTQETSVELQGTDVLHLLLDANTVFQMEMRNKKLTFFPNPMEQTANIEFFNAKHGLVDIEIYSIAGKQVLNYSNVLSKDKHTFSLSGIAFGSYIISVKTGTDHFTGKFVSVKQTESSPVLSHKLGEKAINNTESAGSIEPSLRNISGNKDSKSVVVMDFEIGDELQFTGSADGFENSVILDSPTSNRTYTFDFTELFLCGEPYTDTRDDNIYQTVQIGAQCWMAKNLAYLPEITYEDDWNSFTEPQYTVYGYSPGSGSETVEGAKASEHYENYGVLYNWAAAVTACPPGWHLPNDDEWTELINYVVAQGYANEWDSINGVGNALKSCLQVDSPLGGSCDTDEHPRWDSDSQHSGFDEFGFSALPGGFRGLNNYYGAIGSSGEWWSATDNNDQRAESYFIGSYFGDLSTYDLVNKRVGLSVRCVKD